MSSLQPKSLASSEPQPSSSTNSLRSLKGSMTLPLQSSVNAGNGAVVRGLTPLAQLNSPDLKNLASGSGVTPFLTSPDFDKLISQSLNVGMTPTSANSGNQAQTPTTFLNPKYVTEEQERFVMNFDEKIKSMIKKEQEAGTDENHVASNSVMMDISGSSYAAQQQQQQQTVSLSVEADEQAAFDSAAASSSSAPHQHQHQHLHQPISSAAAAVVAAASLASSSSCNDDAMDGSSQQPLSPADSDRQLDLSDQEVLKLERKRQRNRDAARKCRERKLERIRFLEERVSELKSQNSKLQRTAVDLREQVRTLQQLIVEHTKRGCSLKESMPTAAKITTK